MINHGWTVFVCTVERIEFFDVWVAFYPAKIAYARHVVYSAKTNCVCHRTNIRNFLSKCLRNCLQMIGPGVTSPFFLPDVSPLTVKHSFPSFETIFLGRSVSGSVPLRSTVHWRRNFSVVIHLIRIEFAINARTRISEDIEKQLRQNFAEKTVDVVHRNQLSYDAFVEIYMSQNRPVLIQARSFDALFAFKSLLGLYRKLEG